MHLLGLALIAAASAVETTVDADDHGDDRASATRIELPSQIGGAIVPHDDEDWFRFKVAARGEVVAETTGGLGTWGVLYDADGNVVVLDDSSRGVNFSIRRMLDAGTYFLRVGSYLNNAGALAL